MAIDASIALGVKPVQIESPLNQMANVYALQNAQQSNQLNQLKMDEYNRGVAQSEQRRNYLSTAKRDDPEFINNLAAIDPELAMKLETHMAGLNKEKALADAAKFKLANDNYTQYRSTLAGLSTVPNLTKDMAISEAQRLVDAGVVPANFVTMAQQLPDEPMALRSVLQNGARAQLTPDKIFTMFAPKPVERATNRYKVMFDENPNSPTFGKEIAKTRIEMGVSPDAELSAATQRRQQDLTNARELEKIAIDKGKNSSEYIAMEAKMKEQGKGQAKFEAAAPQAITTAKQLLTKIDDLVGKPAIKDKKGKIIKEGTGAHKGFSAAVGTESIFPTMPGSQASNFEARLDEIKGGAFLEAFETLRGGGSITETEGTKATAARTRMSTAQSEDEFIAAARDYQNIIRAGIKNAKEKLAKGNKTSTTTTPAGATVSNWQD